MAIRFYEESGEFHLFNGQISYIMKILKNGQIGHLYYGKKLRERPDFGHMLEYAYRDMAPCEFDEDVRFSLENIKQEYPCYASADNRYTALDIEESNGNRVHKFCYHSHCIAEGKPELEGLPNTYVEHADEAQTLEIVLKDVCSELSLVLSYTIYEKLPVITRNTKFISENEEPVILHTAMSLSLDLPDKDYIMIDLTGAWGRERHIREHGLDYGIQGVYSMRGHSSHQFNPFLALKRKETTEKSGEVIAVSLVYSGDFLAQAEVDNYDVTRILMGIHPAGFDWELKKGESFQTPEAVLVYSENGLNGMSQTFHTLYRTRLARGYWRDRRRPILINNWEATYLDFNEEKLLKLAAEARDLGIELFVLDDGWFGKRDDVHSALGDWYPNKEKLPGGIAGISQKIRALGMDFGLWIEPEMVNENSELYRAYPDWLLSSADRPRSVGRHQYVLDFSKKEVVDYLFEQLQKVLEEGKVSYVKWDMNRSISEAFSVGKDKAWQGKVRHLHMLGIYELYERLNRHFPKVLFESCASGGGRFDPGMLYYAPQGWISDDTDAVERLKIQYGTSIVYPLSSMGSHVSAVPNHQLFRETPLSTRANTAYFGTFGYELDLGKLDEEEKEEIKEQIRFRIRYWELFQNGTFYRLESPFQGNSTAWMVINEEKTEVLAGWYRTLQTVNIGFRTLCLQGLDPDMEYRLENTGQIYYGDELMQNGFSVSDRSSGVLDHPLRQGDYTSCLYHLKKVP